MIFVRPGSGLCNRLRVIGGAIIFSRKYGVPLKIEWFHCPFKRWAAMCGMRVKFSDLFEPVADVEVVEKVKVRNDFPWNARVWSDRNANFYGEADQGKIAERDGEKFVFDVLKNPSENRWIWTCYDFCPGNDYSWLHPKPDILARVNAFSHSFGDNCIGLHIRRTDHKLSIKSSPIELFEEKIYHEIKTSGDVKFFLSTDDDDTRKKLSKKFGDRVLSCESVSARYTKKGETDALIDLLLLSRTRKIYGSCGSTFSEEAAKIGRVPMEVLRRS